MSDAARPLERWSSLGLLHPDGAAPRSVVVGSGCPAKLRPARTLAPSDAMLGGAAADLVVVYPGRGERGRRVWLEEAIGTAATLLDDDGVIYAVVPPLQRRRAATLLRARGLDVVAMLAHLPDAATSRYIVPLRTRALRYALTRLMPGRPRARRVARVALAAPAVEHVLAAVLPSVAVVARRFRARRPLEWVARLQPDGDAGAMSMANVVLVTSWRPQGGPTVLHVLDGGGERAVLVVKAPASADDVALITGEEAILRRLGPAALDAGARLPQARLAHLDGGRPVLVQTAVAGRPLAAVVAESPGVLAPTLDAVSAWLERWNSATSRVEMLDAATLDRDVLAPAALVTPRLAAGAEYRRWLVTRCADVAGTRVPLVARHNDLTMRNVLVDGDGPLGIVDWETGDERGLPIGDLAYAILDAANAAAGASRAAAFAQCFLPDGEHAPLARRLLARSCRALEVSPPLAEVAFHGCWLRHAADELRATDGHGGPFLAIVERLARERDRVCTGMPV